MDEKKEYAIWKVYGSPDFFKGGEVDEILKNGRVTIKSDLKTKPVYIYHSLHSLGEGKEIMKRLRELLEEYREKVNELNKELKTKINNLIP